MKRKTTKQAAPATRAQTTLLRRYARLRRNEAKAKAAAAAIESEVFRAVEDLGGSVSHEGCSFTAGRTVTHLYPGDVRALARELAAKQKAARDGGLTETTEKPRLIFRDRGEVEAGQPIRVGKKKAAAEKGGAA